jgi:uncharacterized protein YbjT (DUF2867 family)
MPASRLSPAPAQRTVLVIGATGNQGGAVVNALLASGRPWRVRALTRNPGRPAARALAGRGVEVVRGNLDDPASIEAALDAVQGVFSVQNHRASGLDGEVRQGKLVADLAARASVEHLVYSSVGGAERVRGIPHFDSKWQVEQHIRATGLPATILRPVSFMDGLQARGVRSIALSILAGAVGPGKPLQLIAVADIGIFARLALERPGDFLGRAIEIAGDERTVGQIAAALRQATGARVPYLRLPRALLHLMGPQAKMFDWFREAGYQADIPALRRLHPDLLTFDAWLHASTEPTTTRATTPGAPVPGS